METNDLPHKVLECAAETLGCSISELEIGETVAKTEYVNYCHFSYGGKSVTVCLYHDGYIGIVGKGELWGHVTYPTTH